MLLQVHVIHDIMLEVGEKKLCKCTKFLAKVYKALNSIKGYEKVIKSKRRRKKVYDHIMCV